jgi:hypothetical protein
MHHLGLTRSRLKLLVVLTATSLTLGACAAVQTAARLPAPASARSSDEAPALNVPPGHYPAPGMCRVWIPGRPPGRQARPVACSVAVANAPAGSWVLYRASARELHSRVIDSQRKGVVVRVYVYNAEGGRYLRTERPE